MLPDLLSNRELAEVHPDFQDGIREHRLIDAFTNRHPVFLRSAGRIGGEMRRFRGILVDIFYDHFLYVRWLQFCTQPLEEFVSTFHASTALLRPLLPEVAVVRLRQMEAGG